MQVVVTSLPSYEGDLHPMYYVLGVVPFNGGAPVVEVFDDLTQAQEYALALTEALAKRKSLEANNIVSFWRGRGGWNNIVPFFYC